MVNTRYRSTLPEIMDDFSMQGEILRDALDKIARINQLLGGNKITLQGVKKLLLDKDKNNEITIVDIGCGNGDMLRTLAEYAIKKKLILKLIGIDANEYAVSHAKNLSLEYTNITYRCLDIFDGFCQAAPYDILLCTLTLHHFKNEEIITLLGYFKKYSKIGFVVNDLHRSAVAYYLFKALCFTFRLNDMSREDGLISILRGFKKADLLLFSNLLNFKNYKLRWKWAFRYQWIVKTI